MREEIPIPCSFVRDTDKLSDTTIADKKIDIETENMLKFFQSSEKTLEYDISKAMWSLSCEVLKSLYTILPEDLTEIETDTFDNKKDKFYGKLEGRGKSEFAYALTQSLLAAQDQWETLKSQIPEYIQNAIKHVVDKIKIHPPMAGTESTSAASDRD